MLAGPVVGQRDPRIQSPSPVVVKPLFLGPYSLAQWRLKAQGYKTRDYRIQDTDRDRDAGYKAAELSRPKTEDSPPSLAAWWPQGAGGYVYKYYRVLFYIIL